LFEVFDLLEHFIKLSLEVFSKFVDVDLGAAEAKVRKVAEGPGDDLLTSQVKEGLVLHMHSLNILLLAYFSLSFYLLFTTGSDLDKHLEVVFKLVVYVSKTSGNIKASLFCFFGPCLAVAVTLKPDLLSFFSELIHDLINSFTFFDLFGG